MVFTHQRPQNFRLYVECCGRSIDGFNFLPRQIQIAAHVDDLNEDCVFNKIWKRSQMLRKQKVWWFCDVNNYVDEKCQEWHPKNRTQWIYLTATLVSVPLAFYIKKCWEFIIDVSEELNSWTWTVTGLHWIISTAFCNVKLWRGSCELF